MNKREQEIKNKKGNRFTYSSDQGLSVVSEDKVEKSEQDTLTHTFSGKINKEEVLSGGKADNLTIEDIAKKHNVSVDKIKKQLQMGIMVEMEHTNDPKQSIEIVMDHLTESSEYYTKLAKMESTFDKQKTEK